MKPLISGSLARSLLPLALVAALGLVGPAHAAEDGSIGEVTSVFKRVEILPLGRKGQWLKVDKGRRIHLKDVIRTGPRGRARIKFDDRLNEANAGPSIVNLGSSTEVEMESFKISLTDPKRSKGIIGLIRGTLRSFMKNWGANGNFQVRTGTSLCGIRGSESVVRSTGPNGKVWQSCFSGNCFSLNDLTPSDGKPLSTGWQRYMPDSDPNNWRDIKLTQQRMQQLLNQTTDDPTKPGVTEDSKHRQQFGSGGGLGGTGTGTGTGGGTLRPGDTWMGVKWTSEGLPDCRAEVLDLVLNSYKWDDIKDYREFTFYKDELVNDRFVVSGQIKTDCPANILHIEVSVDGGTSWVRARFSKESLTFRYEFDPSGFQDLDIRVRPTFKKEITDEAQVMMGLRRPDE